MTSPIPRKQQARRAVHGIVLLDKPLGDSSNRALQRVKRLYGAKKAGHTGSLDPLATGMLPLCFGEATKIAGMLLGSRKAYWAEALLGVRTETGDAEGAVLQRCAVPALSDADIEQAMQNFRGLIQQVPPVYSALKQGGEPLYRKARRGEKVTVSARQVEVMRFDLLERDSEHLRVQVECGSGTYIRSLLSDLGDALGCGAHLTQLRRTWVEPFRGNRMFGIEELEQRAEQGQDALQECLLPVDAGLANLAEVRLDANDSRAIAQGRAIKGTATSLCRAYADDGRLLALLEPDGKGHLKVRRGFNLEPRD